MLEAPVERTKIIMPLSNEQLMLAVLERIERLLLTINEHLIYKNKTPVAQQTPRGKR